MGVNWRFRQQSGQSFVELAILLPILLLLFAGLVEVGFFIYTYLNAVDLTREAARFASLRDPFVMDAPGSGLPESSCSSDDFHYYFKTACLILDPGFNPYLEFDTEVDDITISVVTVSGDVVTDRWPADGDGVWSLASASDTWPGSESWTKDCQGNVVRTEPFFTNSEIMSMFQSGAPPNRGLVIVEIYYCYQQVLNLPVLSDAIPNPIRMHVFSWMPAFEAIPTPTPIP
jgi:hypothetical protein